MGQRNSMYFDKMVADEPMPTIRYLAADEDYSIHDTDSKSWFRVFYKQEMVALVMSLDTARQVIYREKQVRGDSCEYLNEDDFIQCLSL